MWLYIESRVMSIFLQKVKGNELYNIVDART